MLTIDGYIFFNCELWGALCPTIHHLIFDYFEHTIMNDENSGC